jgi:hypothetical protein
MSSTDDSLAEWGMQFVNLVDEKLQEPGHEETLAFWKEGEFTEAYAELQKLYPEVSDEQWAWVEEFLSEI